MHLKKIHFFPSLLLTLICHFSLGDKVKRVPSAGPEVEEKNDKAEMYLDDLVIEVQPPPGRKSILNTRVTMNPRWENLDNDNFEDLPEIRSDAARPEIGIVENRQSEKSPRKREITSRNGGQLREKFFTSFDKVSLRKKLSRDKRSSSLLFEDYGERIKPAAMQNNSSCRRKKRSEHVRIISESADDRACLENRKVFEEHFDKQTRPNRDLMGNLGTYKQIQEIVGGYGESDLMLSGRKFYQQHHDPLRCDFRAEYRSLDGSCNNLLNPSWGRRNTAFGRILPPRYSDGIHGMPISVTNAELPNARHLSTKLIARGTKYDSDFTLAMMQWGQVMAHDMARQIIDRTTEGPIECCESDGKSGVNESRRHPSCAPISISPKDPFYSRYGQRCMNFARSRTIHRENGSRRSADQINPVTSFLDCSQVYGIGRTESNELREFIGGRLKAELRNGRWMLPITKNRSDTCDIWRSNDFCYKSGDFRTCQNLQLVILQTLLMREHNRVADVLSSLNPHWTDEKLFQEARRIVIGEYQHITYNEWLPLLLGKRNAGRNNFLRAEDKLSGGYNENVDPSVLIGFTSGAFRSLHSMIAGHFGAYNVDRHLVDVLRLDAHFYRPKVLEEDDYFAGLLRGLITQFGEMQDSSVNSQVTEYLFRSRKDFGKDLIALDIQRGRDHGVPSYNAYRKICHLRPAENFDDLSEEISWENIEKLRQEYAHVDDVDLIVGLLLENPLKDSHLGPTNRCIIAEQFYRSRAGDRFFYDNADFPHSFTPEQFGEITKVTLARLICDTENDVGIIQRQAFRSISRGNALVACETLPKMDLSLWTE